MSDTTTPASLPIFGYVIVEHHFTSDTPMGPAEYNTDTYFDFEPFSGGDNIAVCEQAPAQAVIDELRAEVERLTRERDTAIADAKEIRARWNDAENEIAALKAQPVAARPDVEAVMGLAEDLVVAAMTEADSPSSCKGVENAARSALRAALQALQPADEAKDEKPSLPEWRVDEIAHKHGDYDQRSVCFCFSADSQCRFHIYDFVRDCIDAALTLHQTDTKEQQP